MPELVLYGIILLAKQFLGAILDIEVDQSDSLLSNLDVTFLILSKVEVVNEIFTNSSLFLNSRAKSNKLDYNSSSSSPPLIAKGYVTLL